MRSLEYDHKVLALFALRAVISVHIQTAPSPDVPVHYLSCPISNCQIPAASLHTAREKTISIFKFFER